jgi:hypothetical protein
MTAVNPFRDRRRTLSTLLQLGALPWLALAPTPAVATTLYALVDTGEIFASETSGATWEVRATLPVPDAVALIGGESPEELYLATERGLVHRSASAGADWDIVGAVPVSDVVDLAGRDGAILLLTQSGLLWRSLDFGTTFDAIATLGASDAVSLVLGPDAALYAATRTGWIRRSIDGGVSWAVVGTVPVSDARSLRTRAGSLYLLSESGLVHRSADAGATWTTFGTTSQVGMRGLAPLGADLVAVTREGLVGRSATGAAWSWVGHVNQLRVTALANDVPQVSSVPDGPPSRPAPLRVTAAWPNPVRAGGLVRLETSGGTPERAFATELFDAAGRLVSRRSGLASATAGSVLDWPTDGLAPGVYLLRVRQGGAAASRRIVVID